jgi:excisionase family DNA binding protein
MRKKQIDRDALFQPIRGAAEITGFSVKYIREGCKAGEIPHIRAGSDYRIDMTAWLEMLHSASRGA